MKRFNNNKSKLDKNSEYSNARSRSIKRTDYGNNSEYLTKPTNIMEGKNIIKHPTLPGAELNVMDGVNSLAVNLTPNQSLEHIPVEYPLFNSDNATEEYTFDGIPAWNGSIVQQSVMFENTIFNKYFDSISSRVKLRYGFYNYTDSGMYGQNAIFQRAVITGISQLDSTLYRDLMFNTSVAGSGFTSSVNGITDVRILSLLTYQSFLQNIMLVMSAYVRLRKLDKTMYDMCYKRGYNTVRDLMLQIKKSVYESKIQNLAKMLGDCFFDYDWFKTWRAFSDGVSRQSNSVDDPLLSTVCSYYVPSCKLAPVNSPGSPYFNTDTLKCTSYSFSHPLYAKKKDGSVTRSTFSGLNIEELTKVYVELTSAHNVIEWARMSVLDKSTAIPATEYFNNLCSIIDAITEVFTEFKVQATPIDVFMNVAKRSNWLKWQKTDANTVFNFSESSISLKYNKFLTDLLTNIHFGPANFSFDTNSQAFSGVIAWYLDKEVASYEQHTGGLPYLASIRDFDLTGVNSGDQGLLIPKLFDCFVSGSDQIHNSSNLNQGSNGVIKRYINHTATSAINRLADNITIVSNVSDIDAINGSMTISRLNIPDNNQIKFSIKIPSVTFATNDNRLISAVYRLLTNTFYAGSVTETSGINTNMYYLDPNLIGFVDWQMKPTSLQVQNYIYTSAPFSGVGYSKSSDLGSVNNSDN